MTKEVKQGQGSESVPADVMTSAQYNAEKLVKKILGEKDTEAVLQRLDRLSQNEARITAREILRVVYGLVEDTSE
jgi:hypothetical protein